jgi:predicted TPR repeat methyltransferase
MPVSLKIPDKAIGSLRKGYSGYRPDIVRLMPPDFKRVLDVGCGAGMLGREIKELAPGSIVIGLENNADLAMQAEKHLDKVITADLNSDEFYAKFDSEQFDVIVLADILEHLVAPESLLLKLKNYLSKDGCIITSLPNVRHYSTFISLFILGSWPQRARGIHDKTHLHYYARKNIIDLLHDCGLEPVRESRNVRLVEFMSWTNIPGKLLDFWPFRQFFTFQYLHLSKKSADDEKA